MTEDAIADAGRTLSLLESPSQDPAPRYKRRIDGRTIEFRLAHLAPELSDYVVAHETAHLVELNHSKRFWRLVETLYPDWRAARQRIGRSGATLPILQEGPP